MTCCLHLEEHLTAQICSHELPDVSTRPRERERLKPGCHLRIMGWCEKIPGAEVPCKPHLTIMRVSSMHISDDLLGSATLERLPSRCMDATSVFLGGQALPNHMRHTSE
jgi:hypothetical protein